MATPANNSPSAQKKQTCGEPAAPPPPVPVFAEVPCPRDQRAYRLHLDGRTQRWIAARLKCKQPTVSRGIRRMEKWLATTLPEDRGEYTATEKLRLALAKHELRMERVIKTSLREFRQSRQTIPMKKTITTTQTTNKQGEKVKIRVEEWDKPQIGRKGFLDSATKASHEITVLAAGYLGPGSGSISMAEVMDPEERDRWYRIVTIQDAKIKELEKRVHELESRPSTSGEEGAQDQSAPVSRIAENEPAVNQKPAEQVAATSGQPTACAAPADTRACQTPTRKTCINELPRIGTEPPRIGTFSAGSQEQVARPQEHPPSRTGPGPQQKPNPQHEIV